MYYIPLIRTCSSETETDAVVRSERNETTCVS